MGIQLHSWTRALGDGGGRRQITTRARCRTGMIYTYALGLRFGVSVVCSRALCFCSLQEVNAGVGVDLLRIRRTGQRCAQREQEERHLCPQPRRRRGVVEAGRGGEGRCRVCVAAVVSDPIPRRAGAGRACYLGVVKPHLMCSRHASRQSRCTRWLRGHQRTPRRMRGTPQSGWHETACCGPRSGSGLEPRRGVGASTLNGRKERRIALYSALESCNFHSLRWAQA